MDASLEATAALKTNRMTSNLGLLNIVFQNYFADFCWYIWWIFLELTIFLFVWMGLVYSQPAKRENNV